MINRDLVSDKLLAYLNQKMTLAELVDWAADCFAIGGFGPEEDIPLLRDVLMYLAAADTSAFPLTWEVCIDFMQQLGTPVKVVPVNPRS
ncbi:MAG TPA: hypothetical protein PKD09_13540 [Aggregatilinea sp.]|jgi:hypothetical protein|uniref:hypothetical protein n=1 Tax=Aggregatilinea sp. TaxID=2806333 RepID=UPI002C59115C|nr:hypothetical protein [Aggregatilinea sp.]HML22670.1 hypothetical protein [Aggregatilinea sp.]